MVNNFDLINKYLKFYNNRSFYFIQVLKRKKENPEMHSYALQIESYYIFSNEQFERVMPHIIEKCEQNRARAYIKLNCLDALSVGLATISCLTQEIRKEHWKALNACFNMACGQCGKQDGTEKLYLIDLDNETPESCQKYIDVINGLPPVNNTDKIKLIVPTRNGVHLMCTGFELPMFKQIYPKIDIHDDGNTLLYFPACCDEKPDNQSNQAESDAAEISDK